MSDVRGYVTLAETADAHQLAGMLNEHRARMSDIVVARGGTVMQYVGDMVFAVFGAPDPAADHASRAVAAAAEMRSAQREINQRWAAAGLRTFEIGNGDGQGPRGAGHCLQAGKRAGNERLTELGEGIVESQSARCDAWLASLATRGHVGQ